MFIPAVRCVCPSAILPCQSFKIIHNSCESLWQTLMSAHFKHWMQFSKNYPPGLFVWHKKSSRNSSCCCWSKMNTVSFDLIPPQTFWRERIVFEDFVNKDVDVKRELSALCSSIHRLSALCFWRESKHCWLIFHPLMKELIGQTIGRSKKSVKASKRAEKGLIYVWMVERWIDACWCCLWLKKYAYNIHGKTLNTSILVQDILLFSFIKKLYTFINI